MNKSLLKKIPAVNNLLEQEEIKQIKREYSHELVVNVIREVIQNIREKIIAGEINEESKSLTFSHITGEVIKRVEQKLGMNLDKVINATGVIVHTNLGRSLLSNRAREAVVNVADNYSNLEIDLKSGKRGSRYSHVSKLILELTGAEDCLIVNNNAAAVLLALSSLARGKEVIIARGELVEIGGSFRIPEVMEQSGAELIEVGATNKVYLRDYQQAITEKTGLLLKVHTSNYRIMGFSHSVDLAKLIQLGREEELPVMEDLGSGVMFNFESYGLSYEPTVSERIRTGVDVVTFSGDKLLGGPQAGIIVGKKKFIKDMKKHPLNRALRVDKFTLAALEATLLAYLKGKEWAIKEIPTLRMLTLSGLEIKEIAEDFYKKIKNELKKNWEVNLDKDYSQVGGGAFPLEKLPTYVLKLKHKKFSESEVARRLRTNKPPVFCRLQDGQVLIDFRTVRKEDFPELISAIKKV